MQFQITSFCIATYLLTFNLIEFDFCVAINEVCNLLNPSLKKVCSVQCYLFYALN